MVCYISVPIEEKVPAGKSEFIPEIRIQTSTPNNAATAKVKNEHELNDEGFEETQSLVSETPSQGTSSDVVDSSGGKPKRRITSNLSRSSSVRGEAGRASVIPRRTASLRKTDSSLRERSNSRTSLRSSRSSLNSAASVNTVKNSPASGVRLAGYTSAIKALTSNLAKDQPVRRVASLQSPAKKPLGPVQLKQRSVPASRSSSSGSSIG